MKYFIVLDDSLANDNTFVDLDCASVFEGNDEDIIEKILDHYQLDADVVKNMKIFNDCDATTLNVCLSRKSSF